MIRSISFRNVSRAGLDSRLAGSKPGGDGDGSDFPRGSVDLGTQNRARWGRIYIFSPRVNRGPLKFTCSPTKLAYIAKVIPRREATKPQIYEPQLLHSPPTLIHSILTLCPALSRHSSLSVVAWCR